MYVDLLGKVRTLKDRKTSKIMLAEVFLRKITYSTYGDLLCHAANSKPRYLPIYDVTLTLRFICLKLLVYYYLFLLSSKVPLSASTDTFSQHHTLSPCMHRMCRWHHMQWHCWHMNRNDCSWWNSIWYSHLDWISIG